MRVTPDNIQYLEPNEIFVFGSNLSGKHFGGAAKTAHDKFGAKYGIGIGLYGQTYALATMGYHLEVLAIIEVKTQVDNLLEVVKDRPDLHFYVTKIGCGIAGFTIDQIAPLFKEFISLENCSLPIEFIELNN